MLSVTPPGPKSRRLESNQPTLSYQDSARPREQRRRLKFKSRRLDSHQYRPAYKAGAFLYRATSAISRTRRSRTFLSGFGGRVLSQEQSPMGRPGGFEPATSTFTASHADHYTTDGIQGPGLEPGTSV
jgi:hypothetical protein